MKTRFRTTEPRTRGRARWPVLLGGIGLGSALSYLLDPSLGRGRRARARQKALRAARLGSRDARHLEHDLSNRAHGFLARLRAAVRTEIPDDEIVKERVRSALGRASSHAGAIEVSVTNGTVGIKGPVLEREHARVVREIQRVRGVRAVEDGLERHVHPAGVPGLQESRARPLASATQSARCADLMKPNVQSIGGGETVHRAAELMMLANVGFLPVCDGERRVIGTITDRDIVLRAVAKDRSPETCRVEEVMTSPVIACRSDDELTWAEQLMIQHQVSRMVITDQDGALRGVISLSDIAEREPARRAGRTLRAVAAREAPRS